MSLHTLPLSHRLIQLSILRRILTCLLMGIVSSSAVQAADFVVPKGHAIHPFALRAKGKPVYDGYLTSSASGVGLPMHQCGHAFHPTIRD